MVFQMDMGKIITQTEAYLKEVLLMGFHMVMADLSCQMVIIIKVRLSLEEQMGLEHTKLIHLLIKETLKIM